MPDPLVSEALAEAYASPPDGCVILETLEIWHPAFTAALRIVADHRALDARLEDGAPRQAGEVVTFIPLAFRLRPPEAVAEAPGVLEAEIDATGREIIAELEAASVSLAPVEVIWRRYIEAMAADGPDYVVGGLRVRSASATPGRLVARAGWHDLLGERFPRLVYARDRFPTLEGEA
jgi:Domain of unknown function (DUF1833).